MPIPSSHLLNLGLLGSVVVALFGMNYAVDPFNANRAVDLGFNKEDVTRQLSRWDWNMAEFAADPKPVVMLGDSRMGKLDASRIAGHLGRPTYNFSYGGGTLADMLTTFWVADSIAELEHVIMGFNLNILNQNKSYDAAAQARDLLEDPLRYYYSPFVTGASARVLWFNLGLGRAYTEKPPMNPEKFWAFKMSYGRQVYSSYAYPTGLLARLEAIVEHCERTGIQLTFMTFPTHVSLQDLAVEYDLVDDRDRTRAALKGLAPTWDYDVPNRVTRDPDNFTDPFHFSQ
jgi:hypothetical protein